MLTVASGIPTSTLPKLLGAIGEALANSAHVEFVLDWLTAVATAHGGAIQQLSASEVRPAIRALQRSVADIHDSLKTACDSNLFTLRYLSQAGQS